MLAVQLCRILSAVLYSGSATVCRTHKSRCMPPCCALAALWLQVIHMLKGVANPGPAFQLDAVRDAYTPRPGVHLHSSSHGSTRSLLARFAQAATAVRRVQAFCTAAVRCAGSVGVDMAAGSGGSQEQREERRLYSLPTVAAFAAAVAEQQQGLQQQVLVLEAAFNSGALTSLLQLEQRTTGLAQQAAMLAALARRCCTWRGSAAETAAGLLSSLYAALQLQLLQARSQGGLLGTSVCGVARQRGHAHATSAVRTRGLHMRLSAAAALCMPTQCISNLIPSPCLALFPAFLQAGWLPPCYCASSPLPAARCWRCCTAG